ncbi:hypothetical protein [Nocardia sp. NPDC057440]|uniref:hypothetical protein n=1 Tax=Nocardia sp. NPDC057440 TaxID=3346134 RepID=UPI00366F1286
MQEYQGKDILIDGDGWARSIEAKLSSVELIDEDGLWVTAYIDEMEVGIQISGLTPAKLLSSLQGK